MPREPLPRSGVGHCRTTPGQHLDGTAGRKVRVVEFPAPDINGCQTPNGTGTGTVFTDNCPDCIRKVNILHESVRILHVALTVCPEEFLMEQSGFAAL